MLVIENGAFDPGTDLHFMCLVIMAKSPHGKVTRYTFLQRRVVSAYTQRKRDLDRLVRK